MAGTRVDLDGFHPDVAHSIRLSQSSKQLPSAMLMNQEASKMELRQIRSFIVLSEELHFGRAAVRLHLAQPALSQQIKQLEEHLGTELFKRTSRSVALSEAGARFLPHARAALGSLADGEQELKSVDSGAVGSVHVGFVSTAAVQLIPGLLARLKKAHPAIQLHLKEADTAAQVQGLLSGTLDIGLLHATELHPALESRPAESSEVVVALPANHPLAISASISLKDLSHDTLILPAPTPHRDFHDLILTLCETSGFVPRQRQEVTMLQTALPLIAAGAGCALLPDAFERLKPRGVAFRRIKGPKVHLPIYVVVRRDGMTRLLKNVLQQVSQNGTASR
jgi:DNA-binding transcriptional LysR family regulator